MDWEIRDAKAQLPDAIYGGLADGAKRSWDFLKSGTGSQILNFYQATAYLCEVAECAFIRQPRPRRSAVPLGTENSMGN